MRARGNIEMSESTAQAMWTAFGNRYHQQVTSASISGLMTSLTSILRTGSQEATARGSRAPSSSLRPTSRPRFLNMGLGPRVLTCSVDTRDLVTTSRTRTLPGPSTAFSPPRSSEAPHFPFTLEFFFRIPSEPVSGMSRSGERCTGVTMSRIIRALASILRLTSLSPRALWHRVQRSGSRSRRSWCAAA